MFVDPFDGNLLPYVKTIDIPLCYQNGIILIAASLSMLTSLQRTLSEGECINVPMESIHLTKSLEKIVFAK